MEIRYPVYYDTFRCLAGACPDSCCKEWAVAIDPEAEAKYRALPGEVGEALRAAMCEEDGDTILALTPDRRCPMWRQDGLCRIQSQLGEEWLCNTCRQFPRLRHDYGDFVELGLELSCPEAARLILSGERQEILTRQEIGGETPEYAPEDMAILLTSRQQALEILANPKYSLGEALAILLLLGYSAQSVLDGEDAEVFDPNQALATAIKLAATGDTAALLALYNELEILTADWKTQLALPLGSDWLDAHRAMARYFVERYWLQAVSDLDLVCRVKFILASCLVVKLVGGDILVTAQRYSKEIENDADNVDALLDAAYTHPAMADIRLLGLLLED